MKITNFGRLKSPRNKSQKLPKRLKSPYVGPKVSRKLPKVTTLAPKVPQKLPKVQREPKVTQKLPKPGPAFGTALQRLTLWGSAVGLFRGRLCSSRKSLSDGGASQKHPKVQNLVQKQSRSFQNLRLLGQLCQCWNFGAAHVY